MEFLLDKQNLDINLSDKILTHWQLRKFINQSNKSFVIFVKDNKNINLIL